MNRKWLIGGVVAAVIGVIVLIAVLIRGDDEPGGWIAKKYNKLSVDTYRSGNSPQKVASEIAKKFKPIDRVDALALASGAGMPAAPVAAPLSAQGVPQSAQGVPLSGEGVPVSAQGVALNAQGSGSSQDGRAVPVSMVAAAQGGIFLQYPKTVVGILPDGAGSRITVDDPDSGYRRYHSYVGTRWTSPGSGGWNRNGTASFRGGGPGSGK
ncbi:DUF4247 domain-containing protein [Actinomadura rudentiformis]|uniref:DUF4247 domain-containing protein n=1 Tax=Actinomadura rudentiformis TaxID=359158 RepID=UPI00178C5DBD|nr:DUF4247 domain-containing protein [Actinomadura rudentiformis]